MSPSVRPIASSSKGPTERLFSCRDLRCRCMGARPQAEPIKPAAEANMDYRKQFVVDPGHKLCLKDIDPAYKGHHESHQTAAPELERYRQKLGQMQALLYAEKKH